MTRNPVWPRDREPPEGDTVPVPYCYEMAFVGWAADIDEEAVQAAINLRWSPDHLLTWWRKEKAANPWSRAIPSAEVILLPDRSAR